MKVNQLLQGAMMTAIYLLLLILYNMGIFPTMISLALPLPLMVHGARSSSVKDVALVFLACLIGSFVVASILGVGTTLIFGLAGTILGIGLVRKWPYWQRIINASLVYLIALPVFTYLMSGVHLGTSLVEIISESMALTESLPFAGDNVPDLQEFQDMVATLIPQLLPTILLLVGLASALVSDALGKFILKRLRLEYPRSENFSRFQLGALIALAYVLTQFLLRAELGDALQVMVINIYFTLNLLFMVQGIVVATAFLRSRGRSRLAPVLVIFALLGNFGALFSTLGVFDAFWDLRKRMVKRFD